MSILQARTFKDIQDMIMEEIKVSDDTTRDRIKRDINAVYMNEICPYENWEWMVKKVDLRQEAFISTGTLTVTESSTSITFSSAPSETKAGWHISIDGFPEVYEIASHTAASTSAALTSKYNGTSSSTATYRLVRPGLPLPVDILDISKAYHDHYKSPMEEKSSQQLNELLLNSQQTAGYPIYYSMSDFTDPDPYDTITGFPVSSSRTSSGYTRALTFAASINSYLEIGDSFKVSGAGNDNYNGSFIVEGIDASNNILYFTAQTQFTEATTTDSGAAIQKEDRERADEVFRQIEVYPKYNDKNTLIHIEGFKRITALEEDTDEPEIPLQDRIVLVYGALHRAWSRHRNPEEAVRNEQLFQRKLAKMAAKVKARYDVPRIKINNIYLASKRLTNRTRSRNWDEF